MIFSIFLLNEHGEVIIKMHFGKKVQKATLEGFWSTYVAPLRFWEEVPAVAMFSSVVFSHIRRDRIMLLLATQQEGSALAALEVLNLIAQILQIYLKTLSENTLRENFSLVYQLLQELLDYGYPLRTEIFALAELVPKPTLENKVRSILENPMLSKATNFSSSPGFKIHPAQRHDSVVWRDSATMHSTNEILFDVVELLDYIMDCEGRLIKASVRGSVEVNCRLSGMPEVRLRLLGTDVVDDIAFHRCVQRLHYDRDNLVNFVPPDGKFTLLQYTCRLENTLAPPLPPFYITPQITFGKTGGRFHCMAGLRGCDGILRREQDKDVQQLSVTLMFPPRTVAVTVTNCSVGSATFERTRGVLTWTIGHLGRHSPSLGGEFVLESTLEGVALQQQQHLIGSAKQNEKLISGDRKHTLLPAGAHAFVCFHIPNYSVSGFRIDSVQIFNETAKAYKGVKYITQAGNFIIRGA